MGSSHFGLTVHSNLICMGYALAGVSMEVKSRGPHSWCSKILIDVQESRRIEVLVLFMYGHLQKLPEACYGDNVNVLMMQIP